MPPALSITSTVADPSALLDLPWDLPLELWPDEVIAALPKGISRHLVRFVNLGDAVIAVKETSEELAHREYDLLRTLERLELPCVEPVAVITNRQAADGEIYDMEKLTAAHRTLPFGTWVRVTNLANGKTVDVRITDRGPFVDGRIIDLSKAGARAIAMLGPGTTRVRLNIVQAPADPAPALAARPPRYALDSLCPDPNTRFRVIGSESVEFGWRDAGPTRSPSPCWSA